MKIDQMTVVKYWLIFLTLTTAAAWVVIIADIMGISPRPAILDRVFFWLIAYAISYAMLLELRIIKKICHFVDWNPL